MAEQDDGQTASTNVKDRGDDAAQGQAGDAADAMTGRASICHPCTDTHQKACGNQNGKVLAGVGFKGAVERLQKLEDLLIVDILREVDRNAEEAGTQSIVPYYLSLMDAERAASVQRKMTKVGDFEEL